PTLNELRLPVQKIWIPLPHLFHEKRHRLGRKRQRRHWPIRKTPGANQLSVFDTTFEVDYAVDNFPVFGANEIAFIDWLRGFQDVLQPEYYQCPPVETIAEGSVDLAQEGFTGIRSDIDYKRIVLLVPLFSNGYGPPKRPRILCCDNFTEFIGYHTLASGKGGSGSKFELGLTVFIFSCVPGIHGRLRFDGVL